MTLTRRDFIKLNAVAATAAAAGLSVPGLNTAMAAEDTSSVAKNQNMSCLKSMVSGIWHRPLSWRRYPLPVCHRR